MTELTKDQAIRRAKAELIRLELARRSMKYFVPHINQNYKAEWFHTYIMSRLDAFERGEVKKIMISLPPQTGKSELSTRTFIPYAIGKNPRRKIAVVTYGQQLSNSFNRDIKANMMSKEYKNLFPDIVLGTRAGDMAML